MIVVADTTPLSYLILIGELHLLPALYRTVLIPTQVLAELQRSKAPPPVQTWAAQLPLWCHVEAVTTSPDTALQQLDAGESEAIQLALQRGVALLLFEIRNVLNQNQRYRESLNTPAFSNSQMTPQ